MLECEGRLGHVVPLDPDRRSGSANGGAARRKAYFTKRRYHGA